MDYIKFLFVLSSITAPALVSAQSMTLDEALKQDIGGICILNDQVLNITEDQATLCKEMGGKPGYGPRTSSKSIRATFEKKQIGKGLIEGDHSENPRFQMDPSTMRSDQR